MTSLKAKAKSKQAAKTAPRKKKASVPAASQTIIAYKGFNRDLTCRGFQFEIGETYTAGGKIEACQNGFHACEHPLDCFEYYPPSESRYCEVTQSGDLDRHSVDTKIAAAQITIRVELQFHELIARAVKWVFDRSHPEKGSHATGDYGAASATGYGGAASAAGDYGAASATSNRGAASATGDYGAASATGNRGAASATGDYGAASATGDYGAASATGYGGAASATGDYGAASATGYGGAVSAAGNRGAASATSNRGAASATGNRGAASATGDYGAASATGYGGAASATGYGGAASATGKYSAAMASGCEGIAKGAAGCALFLVNRDETTWEIRNAWAGIVGRDGIKPDTWYRLDEKGAPQEVGSVA